MRTRIPKAEGLQLSFLTTVCPVASGSFSSDDKISDQTHLRRDLRGFCNRVPWRASGDGLDGLHLAPLAMIAEQFERGLEIVHIQPQILIEVCQCLAGERPRVPRVANEASNDCSILLFNPCLIIFPVWTRSRKDNLLLSAVRDQRLVDECAVVV